MSDFSSKHLPFVLNSFVEPNTFSYKSSLLREESSGDPGTCFSSNFPDAFLQEISEQYAKNHRATTLDEANLQVPCNLAVNPSAVANQASDSTAIPMVVGLERTGHYQLLPAEVSAWENKKKKVAETKVEREKKREKQRKNVLGVDKPKESRLKPDVKNKKKVPEENEKDYVLVRARRGEATDKHSLAERVRREKISARMKLLQSLVPGCDSITGKTQILDEIIRYVQFLQHQVESFSAKFAPIDSMFCESGLGLITNTLSLEEFSTLAPPLPPYQLESSSASRLTAFTAPTPPSSSSLLPQPDRHQRLNITTQDQMNMLSETQYQNHKLVYEHHGLDGFSSIGRIGES